ncbi:hypothetical protein Tco_0688024 [Tanacetum coccineum]
MRISVTFHHDGIFIPSPLMYKEGDASTIRDIEFEGITLIGLLKKLKGACQFPIKGIYFLIPGKELNNGLVGIKDDSNLAECIALAFKNEKLIEIYLEHHGYDLSHWVQTEIDDDEVSDVGEMEDITPYGPCDFVGEDDVVIPNRTINDSFLNKLCNGTFISDQTDIPTKEKKKPGRKKTGDAGPSTAAGSATAVDESGPTGVDESGQTVVDESGVEVQMEATVTEDPIQEFENEIPTQTSRTSMKEVVEASIAAGTLKLAGVKRRSKSERIANRAKAFKFEKDSAGSSANKAWDVDEVSYWKRQGNFGVNTAGGTSSASQQIDQDDLEELDIR